MARHDLAEARLREAEEHVAKLRRRVAAWPPHSFEHVTLSGRLEYALAELKERQRRKRYYEGKEAALLAPDEKKP